MNVKTEDVIAMYKKTKEKLENWPLMTCTEEEKTEWFRDTIGPTIAKITLTGDRVEEIIVVDELYDNAAEALTDIPLPADFPDQQNVTRDQLERDFKAYCSQITIRTATVEQLTMPDDNIPPEHVFIRPITSKMKFQGFIEHWDQSIGFTEGLRSMQVPFDFSPEERKMLFGFAHLMNCMAMQANKEQKTDGKAEMYKMD